MEGPPAVSTMRFRIAFIDYLPTHYRRRLYEELARRMEVDFYFFADERERYWNRELATVREGDYRRRELLRLRVAGQAVMPTLSLRLRPSRYDAVVKSLNGKLQLPLTYGAAKASGLPFVLWTGMWYHPATPVHRLTGALTAAIYRGADAIVPYGEHVKRYLLGYSGVQENKVFVAGQAVEPERFAAVEPSTNGQAEVLFVGQFKPYKGIAELLSAWSRVPDPTARLRMVGNGPLEAAIHAAASRDPRIEVVGFVPQERLPGVLARARCLVLPSVTTELDREPWGLVVNEAMHAGLPVVASDAVGAAAGGLVEHGRNGYVVPERDVSALGDVLARLVADPSLARSLGDRARQDVERFTHERMADAFHRAVAHAVSERSPTA